MGCEGTMPSLPRLHLVWWLDVLDLSICTLLFLPCDCTSWLNILRRHLLGFVLLGFNSKDSPAWHWRVQTLFTMRHPHVVIHHDDGMDQVDLYQLVFYLDFALCGLYCLNWLYLIIDLSHCTHWPLTLEEAVPFQGEPQIRSKGTTPFPIHGFWSSGLCMMHLDNSWLRS